MLLDLVHLLATPAPLAHRRLGCVGDSIRMASRSRRCRAAWAPHLATTRDVIRGAIAETRERDTAVILGSGLLDDVPLADLAMGFRRVVLVDAVHPWRSRLAARHFANVEHRTADLSGSFDLLLGRADDLAPPSLPPVCTEPRTGLVVSANLLSQLPIRPVDRLEGAKRGLGRWRPEEGDAFGKAIVTRHLAALETVTARVCLVTDLDEIEEARGGRVLDRIDLLYGVGLPPTDRTWTWELAPFGETVRDVRLLHRVAAYPDWGG